MSGFLATADLQVEFQNLELCTQSWLECIRICKKRYLHYIVFCGDGKEAYDPVSIRVIKWWQWAIECATSRGIKVLYLRGNHDRISTFDVTGSWLSILKRAGAITFDKPGVYDTGSQRFFMLPFAKVKTLRKWMQELLKQKPNRHKDILFFHANLIEGRYSQHGIHSDVGLSVDDLYHDRFRFVIGGDIHLPQKIGENIYYTGSSFCHGWDEVNQRKRYLVVSGRDIQSVHSRIPRWFDDSVNGFDSSKPRVWTGSRIRIQVPCSASEDYRRRLEKSRRKAEKKYKGAEIIVVPKFRDESEGVSSISTEASDAAKLEGYLSEQPISRKVGCEKALKYMLSKLSHFAGGLRGKSKFEFIRAYGEYILSFRKLSIDFRKRGIIVIRGENLDRGGKSNGSGKTGYMQIIPVAICGQTFKKQKHDHWSNRWFRKKQALAGVVGRDDKGNEVEVIRGRRPTQLKMLVNGHNVSSGMKSTDRAGTQAQIESKTGFTWDTLANALYMDRTVINTFLAGTNAQRTNILSRFQNLERFEKALKLVKKDNSENEEQYHESSEKLERVNGRFSEIVGSLHKLRRIRDSQNKKALQSFRKADDKLKRFKVKHKKEITYLETKESKLKKLYKKAFELARKYDEKYYIAKGRWNAAKHQAEKITDLKGKDKCPTCLQKVNWDKMESIRNKAADRLEYAYTTVDRYERRVKYGEKNCEILNDTIFKVTQRLSELDDIKHDLEHDKESAYKQYKQVKISSESFKAIKHTKHKLKKLKHKKHNLKRLKHKLNARRLLYAYVTQAFSRDGIPAYLNRQLAPVLNYAADSYSDLFTDREIQVRFKVEGGEFVPEVINTKGGESINDQSTGELTMAALIAGFAASEIAPKTNLLMLDEPAEGLDEQAARQFAKGLIKLKKRYKTIFITTHNRAIESALSAEHQITIRKKGGISKVHETIH